MPGLDNKFEKYFEKEYYKSLSCKRVIRNFAISKLPFLKYISKYNLKWLHGDLIAGITLGLMIVPQSLAYSKLGSLPYEYGLYSSFVGPLLYSFLGTSKDCGIGPSSIISLFLAQTIHDITEVNSLYNNIQISFCLSFLSGMWLIALGILNLGTIFQFVSSTTIRGFSTGASVVVCFGQLPQVLGIKEVDTHHPVYIIVYNIFRNIKKFYYRNFLIGVSSIIILYGLMRIKEIIEYTSKLFKIRSLSKNKLLKSIIESASLARNIILLLIMIAITSIIYYGNKHSVPYDILEDIKKGFPKVRTSFVDVKLVSLCIVPSLVTSLLITLEHFGSAKAFSIQNKYTIDQNQELLALGMCNLVGSFFGSYPVTGAFSRSAVNSQSGVKTPLSGLLTGGIVIIGMLFLTNIFKLIPSAALAALIFMSLVFKITGYKTIKQFYEIDKGDMLIFVATYVITLVTDIKTGLIASICFSMVVLLVKMNKPRWQLLGQSRVDKDIFEEIKLGKYDKINSEALLTPGIIVFKWQESIIYPNCEYFKTKLLNCVYALSDSRMEPKKLTEKSWSDSSSKDLSELRRKFKNPQFKSKHEFNKSSNQSDQTLRNNEKDIEIYVDSNYNQTEKLPHLKAVILDFGSVNMIDYSSLMILKEIKGLLIEYSGSKSKTLYNDKDFSLVFSNVHKNVLKTLSYIPELVGTANTDRQVNDILQNISETYSENCIEKANDPSRNIYIYPNTKTAYNILLSTQ